MKKLAASIVGASAILGLVLFLFSLENEIPPPTGWPPTVKLYRRTLTGTTRVIDTDSGRVLFMYRPEY
ncbi:MAG: hypothetical protein ACREBC_38775, partial [Pyrinomonadaceae bacterium]